MPGTDDPWGNGGQASGGAPDLATEARRARLARDDRPEAGIWPAPSDGRTVAMEDVRGDDPHELADLRAAASPLWGIDVHPVYQRGLNIEALPGAGIGFLAVKVQQGRDVSYVQSGSADWVRRAKAIGLPVIAYIYLMPGDEDGQAAIFAEVLKALGIAGMVDAEALKGTALAAADGQMPDLGGLGQHPHPRGVVRTSQVRVAGAVPAPALTMDGIRRFHDRCDYHGADVRLDYIPRWWWERLGSPSLTGLPPLWASSYPSIRVGTPQDLYQAVTPDRWAGYGGNQVAILQFAETGLVAGKQPVDVDAYLGTRQQLAALLGTAQPPPIRRSLRMRSVNLDNLDGSTPTRVVELTIDPVRRSLVMPADSAAWFQMQAFYPWAPDGTTCNVQWFQIIDGQGNRLDGLDPFPLHHRQIFQRRLPDGATAVELVIQDIPQGGTIGAHLDCTGHA